MKNKTLAYPYVVWMIIFTIIPLILILHYSFTATTNGDTAFTLYNYRRILDPLYINIIKNSISLAVKCTVVCFVMGYPVAYILSKKEFSNKGTLLFLFIVPMWMNFLLRTYAWLNILGNNGVLNSILVFFGIPRQQLLFTEGAVLMGLVYNFLPFMILPIYTSLQKIDISLIEGAQDLGANTFQVFKKIIFPLSIPGVVSGITMVFMPAVSTFIISNLLGGEQFMLVGNLIEQQFLRVGNWHFGSSLAVLLMILIIISTLLLSFLNKETKEDI